ncbi:MAG: RHS repeat-associated core domain-containing protein [Leptospirales bacterium]
MKKLTKTMVYDHANRITKVKDQTGKVRGEYSYDDQGVRVRKIVEKKVNGKKRRIVMSTHNKYFVTEKLQTRGGWDVPGTDAAINNVYLNGVRIASMDSNGKAAYYLSNHVDSVKVVTDDTGKALSRTEYLPYGETFQQEGDIKFTPKYNGQALDEESDLYYYNARHYDPEIGRFVTADTVTDGPGTIKGWNRYMYVGGNPIMYKDPTGHEGESSYISGPDADRKYGPEIAKGREGTEIQVGPHETKYRPMPELDHVNIEIPYKWQKDNIENPNGSCNATSVGTSLRHDPNFVYSIIKKYPGGYGAEGSLVKYLNKFGFDGKSIVTRRTKRAEGDKRGHIPTFDDFSKMRKELAKGNLILYHFESKSGNNDRVGHYAILKGYDKQDDGSYVYIFHDPAGDRNQKRTFNKQGEDALYSEHFLRQKGNRIKGNVMVIKRIHPFDIKAFANGFK